VPAANDLIPISERRMKNMAESAAADACRVVALGAKTGEEALFKQSEPRHLGGC
jgi:hypothetical protein